MNKRYILKFGVVIGLILLFSGCSNSGITNMKEENRNISSKDNKETIADTSSYEESTVDPFIKYRNVGYENKNLEIVSSELQKSDDGIVYNRVQGYEERDNIFFKTKYVNNCVMCLNGNGLWECCDLGVCSFPDKILEDRISGTYSMHKVASGNASNVNEVLNLVYAKNSKWEIDKYMLNGCVWYKNKKEYDDRITLTLNSDIMLEVVGTVPFDGMTFNINFKHSMSIIDHNIYEVQWQYNDGNFTYDNNTMASDRKVYIAFKEETGEIFLIEYGGGGNGSKRSYLVLSLVMEE